jgi:cysteine desulfuration protein SufE
VLKLDALVAELGEAERRERLEILVDLARTLPALPERYENQKDDAHRIPECASPVYLFVEIERGRARLFADAPAEAPTVRGFVALLLEGLDGLPVAEILAMPDDIIDRSGLGEILGMQRSSGLHAVIRRLRNSVARAVDASATAKSSTL